MRRARGELALGLAVVVVAVGCRGAAGGVAPPKPEARTPTFQDKVAEVEPGLTTQEQASRWFGEPVSVGKFRDGSASWHFRYVQPATAKALERCEPPLSPGVVSRIGAFFGGLLFYPPRQPPPVVPRRFPSRSPELELRVTPDGVVEDVRYQQLEGMALCGA